MKEDTTHFRIAILDMYNGVANEGMRCIKKLIKNFGETEQVEVEYQVFDVRQKLEIPNLDFDAYISTGGPGNPAPSGEQWERKFFYFLDNLLLHNNTRSKKKKKPLFLICHSFQMACIHWQLGAVGKRRKTSFGTFPVHKTAKGKSDVLLNNLPDPFWIVDSRDFQVTQPNQYAFDAMGAKMLCLEKIRPHVKLERAMMAIRFSNEIVGTQFHPEADAEGMLKYFSMDEKRQQIIANYGDDKYQDMIASLSDPDKILLTESVMIPTFLKKAYIKSHPLVIESKD